MPPGGLLTWRGSSSAAGSSSQPPEPSSGVLGGSLNPETLVGVPVAANRGASGIDGVLSSAAGFAAGLQRPVTLVIGDLSFLHDVNGLSLLRGGEMAPPLTVVLINNRGGGIFSFLPVADAVGRAAFERLWGTPQNVDLEGMFAVSCFHLAVSLLGFAGFLLVCRAAALYSCRHKWKSQAVLSCPCCSDCCCLCVDLLPLSPLLLPPPPPLLMLLAVLNRFVSCSRHPPPVCHNP